MIQTFTQQSLLRIHPIRLLIFKMSIFGSANAGSHAVCSSLLAQSSTGALWLAYVQYTLTGSQRGSSTSIVSENQSQTSSSALFSSPHFHHSGLDQYRSYT